MVKKEAGNKMNREPEAYAAGTDNSRQELTLAFTGDIGFDKYMDGKWNDPDLVAPEVLDFLRSADHVVANVEGPMVDAGADPSRGNVAQLLHTMNPAAARVLKNCHADIWNLCNNHMMDAGEEGVAGTLRMAELCGARTIGAGMNIRQASEPLILKEAGGVGLFSVGYRRGCKPAEEDHAGCLLWNDMDRIQRVMDEIRAKCRWCILVVHGGEEFTSLPSPYTRDRYLKFLAMGADIIVAHHPHVPMNYERVGDKIIFYSLGNFIFDTDYQRAQFNTEKGILVKLHLTGNAWKYEAMGLEIRRGPERVSGAPLPAIFENVTEPDYSLLEPLAARMFVAATKRQQIYLNPGKFAHATDEEWRTHFADPKRSGRVPGEALDFQIICPLAEREKEKAWKKSRLEGVKQYILDQM